MSAPRTAIKVDDPVLTLKRVILEGLGIYSNKERLSASWLRRAAANLGSVYDNRFTSSEVWVAVSQLVKAGLIEKDARGGVVWVGDITPEEALKKMPRDKYVRSPRLAGDNWGYTKLQALVDALKRKYPEAGLSFGYIGNVYPPGRGGDDRSWYVFSKLRRPGYSVGATISWGGYSTEDLPEFWDKYRGKLEKLVQKALAENAGSRRAGQERTAKPWSKLPKGWTDESVKKMWDSMTGDVKHKVTKCMKEMEGKVDDTGAFCGSLADKVEGTTKWRGKKAVSLSQFNYQFPLHRDLDHIDSSREKVRLGKGRFDIDGRRAGLLARKGLVDIIEDQFGKYVKLTRRGREALEFSRDVWDRDILASDRSAKGKKAAKSLQPGDAQVGDIVRHTAKFLRNTGQYTGAPVNGRVIEVKTSGFMKGWPVVEWEPGWASPVNPVNLEFDPRHRRRAAVKRVAEKWLAKTAARLDLGRTVMTRGVAHEARQDPTFAQFVRHSLQRHARGDWGDTKGSDRRMNDQALKNGDDRVLSVYNGGPEGKIWIITEWDRSYTTVLFPSEY